MKAALPLSVTYAFGQNNSNTDELKAILTEKVVDRKLKVNQYASPSGLSETICKELYQLIVKCLRFM